MSKPNPKRNRHEQKPDQQAGFKGGHVPSSRAHPKARVGNAEREVWPRVDMREKPRLTGQWRDLEGRFHLFINQAGTHLELLLALVPNGPIRKPGTLPDSDRIMRNVLRLGGDIDLNERWIYHLYAERPQGSPDAKDLVCGKLYLLGKQLQLEFTASAAVVAEIAGTSWRAIERLNSLSGSKVMQFGDVANFFERHLCADWMPVETRTQLWFPPTPQQLTKVGDTIFDARVSLNSENYRLNDKANLAPFGYIDLIIAYFANQSDEEIAAPQRAVRRENIGLALDKVVWTAHANALQLPPEQGGIDEYQDPMWTVKTLEALEKKHVVVVGEKSRSLLQITQVVLQGLAADTPLPSFARLLHLQRTENGDTYNIGLELEVIEWGDSDAQRKAEKLLEKLPGKAIRRMRRWIPRGGLIGKARIDKLGPFGFSAEYAVALSGFKLSRGAAPSQFSADGVAKHVYGQPWLPEQIEGSAMFAQGTFSAFDESEGTAAGLAYLACYGSGAGKPLSPLNFNCSGFSKLFADETGVEGSAIRYRGQLVFIGELPDKFEVDGPSEKAEAFKWGFDPSTGPTLHFPINGAGIEAAGATLLDIFAACELAVLSQPGLEMTLTGSADQPDQDSKNMILSRNRAMSVYNYLKNILEDELAGPELEPIPLPEHEEVADANAQIKKHQQETGTDEIAFTIFMPNQGQYDRIHIVALGEPKPPAGKEVKEEYDQALRRVDILVHGAVSLSLLRKKDS